MTTGKLDTRLEPTGPKFTDYSLEKYEPNFGNRISIVDVQTPWRNLFETPRTEYDEALEELGENSSEKKYYW